jgi:hypothetical protein
VGIPLIIGIRVERGGGEGRHNGSRARLSAVLVAKVARGELTVYPCPTRFKEYD